MSPCFNREEEDAVNGLFILLIVNKAGKQACIFSLFNSKRGNKPVVYKVKEVTDWGIKVKRLLCILTSSSSSAASLSLLPSSALSSSAKASISSASSSRSTGDSSQDTYLKGSEDHVCKPDWIRSFSYQTWHLVESHIIREIIKILLTI